MKNNLRTTIFQLACLFSIATTSFGGLQDRSWNSGWDREFRLRDKRGSASYGLSRLAGDNDTHAFLLQDHGNLIDLSVTYNLGSGPYRGSLLSDINNSGQIVGNSLVVMS